MSTLDRSRPPASGPVQPFSFPAVERRRATNGLALLAARHGKLPLVTIELVVDAGGAAEPADHGGLAYLTAHALDTGTGRRTAAQTAWDLEHLGVELETDVTWDASLVRMTVVRERLEPALDLFADLVRNPVFPDAEVRRLLDEQRAAILQRAKDPRALAHDKASEFIFAPAVPYARPLIGTPESLRRIARGDVVAFHRDRYHAGGAALLMVGDVAGGSGAEALAQRYFGDWRATAPERRPVDVAARLDRTSIFVVNRPGSVQSELRIGHVGLPRHHPDYFAIEVMNSILGGQFTSRLNMNLRERNGFTYGARSGWTFRRQPGPFMVQAAVATDVTAAAIREALGEIEKLRQDGASEEEVATARDFLTGILPLELQTTSQIAGRLADLVIFDLPDHYFQHYRERIAAVTPADVQRVAREHIHPDRFAVVVVGDATQVAPPLEQLQLGPVEVREGP